MHASLVAVTERLWPVGTCTRVRGAGCGPVEHRM